MKILFLILFSFSVQAFAQDIKYSFSEEFETVKNHNELGFYKFNDNQYGNVYYRDRKDLEIQFFDKTFKSLVTQTVIPLPEECKKASIYSLFHLNSEFFLVYTTYKSNNARLIAYPFDKNTLSFKGSEIKLIDTYKVDNDSYYHFEYSKDSSKILVTFRCKPNERKDKINKDVISFNLFDSKLNTLYASDIEMPYTEHDMDNLGYEVDSQGNIYILASVLLNNSVDGETVTGKDSEKASRFELIRVNQKTNGLEAIKMDLEEKYVTSVNLEENNNNMVAVGYYSNNKKGNSTDGAYLYKVVCESNKVKEIVKSYCEFPAEIITANEDEHTIRKMEKKEEKGKLEIPNLKFKKIVFKPDGSMLILGEEYNVVSNTYTSNNKTYTTNTYHYNNILVLKADKNGKTMWCRKIQKRQWGSQDSYLSFYNYSLNDNDYFLYVDDDFDKELAAKLPENDGKGSYLTGISLTNTGQVTKSLFFIDDSDVSIRAKTLESITKNLIVDRLRSDRKRSKVLRLEVK